MDREFTIVIDFSSDACTVYVMKPVILYNPVVMF